MTPSIIDVAKRAGVSPATVSNVLNHPDRVASATRQLVLDTMAELGYVRNDSARQLRTGRSRTVGLVVLDMANPFFIEVAQGVEEAASQAGLALILCSSNESAKKEADYLNLLAELRVEGILITPASRSNEQLERLERQGTGVVLLDSPVWHPGLCSVTVNDVAGGDLAATHLLALGHRHIAYVSGPMEMRQCRDRHDGMTQAIARSGLDVSLTMIEQSSLNVSSGQRAAERLLTQSPRPTGAFCANDLLALGMLQSLTALGVQVPGDVALVGYDDIDFAAAAAVPLSSVRQPRREIGKTAAALLLTEVTEGPKHVHQHVVFEPELVVRASSARRPGHKLSRSSSTRRRAGAGRKPSSPRPPAPEEYPA